MFIDVYGNLKCEAPKIRNKNQKNEILIQLYFNPSKVDRKHSILRNLRIEKQLFVLKAKDNFSANLCRFSY